MHYYVTDLDNYKPKGWLARVRASQAKTMWIVCCNKSMIPLQQLFTYQIELAEEAILGQRSAASLATGPVIPDPFISPLGFTITPALSICYFVPITIHPQSRDTLRSFFSSSFSVLPQRQA